jgi:hypothetical protein
MEEAYPYYIRRPFGEYSTIFVSAEGGKCVASNGDGCGIIPSRYHTNNLKAYILQT